MKKLFIIPFAFLISTACNPTVEPCFNYDVEHPSQIIKLPSKLKEISGITFYSKKRLACVQDEKGTVFIYDIHKDKLKESFDFAGNKDYEAITNVNDTIYVLRSNGDIFEIDHPESDTENSVVHHTFLSKANNCEGLCYDEANRRLLVACKGKPEKHTTEKGMKAVYEFDLDSMKLMKDPVYVINPDSVKALVLKNYEKLNWFQKLFTPDEDGVFYFEPSEIAIEPGTHDVYILSSVNKTLLILSSNGDYKCAIHLNPSIYKQPEGLTFSNDGELIISDEGKDKKANLIFLKPGR
ncbi:MAG: SdiA-regulated domain-containing protein [Bacteroidetes bacterium]|nr:SdiA-regulated domain-containing protein [Bacteroidota bacterium]